MAVTSCPIKGAQRESSAEQERMKEKTSRSNVRRVQSEGSVSLKASDCFSGDHLRIFTVGLDEQPFNPDLLSFNENLINN